MFVTSLEFDGSTGECAEQTIDAPSWEQIKATIQALDGRTRTLVVLSGPGEAHMGIGGGKENHYVVYATFDNESFFDLVGDRSNATITMVCGGQEVSYDVEECADLEQTLKAAQAFATEGVVEKEHGWIEH